MYLLLNEDIEPGVRSDVFDLLGVCIGELYADDNALSVPNRIPNLELANLCAAGESVGSLRLGVMLPTLFGVLILHLALWIACPFLSL